MYTRRTGAGR